MIGSSMRFANCCRDLQNNRQEDFLQKRYNQSNDHLRRERG